MTNPASEPEACSFCFRSRMAVTRLIVGVNGKAICDECVRKGTRAMQESAPGTKVVPMPKAYVK